MSEKNPQDSAASPAAQSQAQRWVTYGSNVAVSCVIVVLLAGMLVYLAQHYTHRLDTTAAGLYSLKPQTLNIIRNNNQHLRIVSLYTRQKPPMAVDEEADQAATVKLDPAVQAQTVADLLEEYKNKGHDIEVEDIDPIQNPAKVDNLIHGIVEKYNGEIQRYEEFIRSLPGQNRQIKLVGDEEFDKLKKLVPEMGKIDSKEVAETLNLVFISVKSLPRQIEENDEAVQRMLTQKLPDYRAITDSVQTTMTALAAVLGKITEDFAKFKNDKSLPPAVCKYMADDLPQYNKLKDLAEAMAKQAADVGQAKLDKYDTLRDALLQNNPILVEGDDAWRIISSDKVWPTNQALARQAQLVGAGQLHPQFAGEQMITTAILGLQMKQKPKVCFVRAGGTPLASDGMPPYVEAGRFSLVADLLRDYNFDVSDKDLTGQWAYQSQGMGGPEPTDADIADAIWVVFNPPNQSNPLGLGPQTIAPKVADHLGANRPALIVTAAGGDNYAVALKSWGITIRSDLLCVHELVQGEVRGDVVDEAQKNPLIFQYSNYGDIPLARPLHSSTGILLEMSPVQISPTKGITLNSFLPLPGAPDAPNSWATTDLRTAMEKNVKFDPVKGDLPNPLFVGATAENEHGQRVVAVGTPYFMENYFVYAPDPDLFKRGIMVRRFPGDPQLFLNIIFWLAHQESMIAISPSAMDVSRVADMGRAAQWLVRYGILLILLPGLVLLAGVWVYFARRD